MSNQSPTESFLKHEMASSSIWRLWFLQLNCSLSYAHYAFASMFFKFRKAMFNIILATAAISNKEAASFIFAEFEQLQPDQLFLCCMKTQK